MKGIFRRVLKFPHEELSDKALRHLFVALDTNNKGKLDFDHFFTLLRDHETVNLRTTSKSRPRSSPQKVQQPPVKQSRPSTTQSSSSSQSSRPVHHRELSEPQVKESNPSKKKGNNSTPAIQDVLKDVERLRGDFDHQLEELGEIGNVIDKLIATMTPNPNN